MSGSRRSRWLAGGTAAVAIAAIAYQALSAMDLRREATVSIIVLVGVLGLLVQRRIALAQRRDAEAERVRLLDDALAWWPPPLVREANPYELGAHPPTSGDYSTREVDVVLEAALAGPGYTLVIGPAGSGKSRAAFEALRRARPEARLLVPEDEASLARLIAGDPQLPDGPQGTILWLDCVDRFLPGLRLDAVDAWIRGAGIVVVATITRETLASLLEGSSPEAHIARRLVARSAAVSVADVLTPAELAAAGDRFPERDFAAGMAGAFRTGWVPAPEPAFSFPPRSAAAPAGRPDASTWLLVIALAVAGAFLWATNDRYDGLAEPPPLADQIVDLGLDLARCGRQTFAGTAESLEARNVLVATVDRDRECESHPRGADPVLVYEYREKRLVPVHDFGPPPGTLPADATFGCRGAPPNPCWTDVTGRGDFAIIGVFRSPRSEALLPVAAWKDDADGWQVAPLVTRAPPLEAGFRAAAYSEPVAGNAHRVADIAVLPPTEGERDLPARVVLGFAPRKALAAPHKLELRAHPLRAGTRVGLDRRCLVVRRGVPDAHLQVPVKPRDAPLSDVLRAAWQRREETGQGICVLSR